MTESDGGTPGGNGGGGGGGGGGLWRRGRKNSAGGLSAVSSLHSGGNVSSYDEADDPALYGDYDDDEDDGFAYDNNDGNGGGASPPRPSRGAKHQPYSRGRQGHPQQQLSKDDSDPSLLKARKNRVVVGVFRRGGKRRSSDDSALEEQKTTSTTTSGTNAGALKNLRFFNKIRRNPNSARRGKGSGSDNINHITNSHCDQSFDGNSIEGYPYGNGEEMAPPRNVAFDLSAMQTDAMLTYASAPQLGHHMLSQSSDHRSFDSNNPRHTYHPGERARYSVHHGSRGGKRKFRVKPFHAFGGEAVYMTEEDIYADSLSPTRQYEFLQSYLKPSSKLALRYPVPDPAKRMWGSPHDDGRIGALRVEVLGCISLARQKPDVCVYAVCGDAAFATDVIAGYRSPMWPSAARRGAVFPLMHGYAKLYLAVFDVKARKNKDNDVFCGRFVLDVATLRPDTEYDITFPLRASSFVYDRKARGVVRLRFALHWFNERAPVWSYWKKPKSLALSSPLHGGLPTIPCADPKTFRNVAVTVYGQDLPGKYTKNAFRATMREFNLYQQNIRHMVKILILNAVMYENPFVSMYLFAAGIHCCWNSSIQLLPPYFVGYILILFIQNHQHYIDETKYNLGYKPLSLWEVARGFFFHFRPELPSFATILLQKRTKRRKNKNKPVAQRLRRLNSLDSAGESAASEKEAEIEMVDHHEFPFADRDAYPKFSVEDALAPSKAKGNRRGSTTRLHGRLSVYYVSEEPTHDAQPGKGDEDDESDEDSDDDRDDETCVSEGGMGDMIYDLDMNDEFDELEMELAPQDKAAVGTHLFQTGDGSSKQRIRVGPPQNSDTKSSKKIPPQVHLKRVEKILHKLSRGVALEIVHPPPDLGLAVEVSESMSKKDKDKKDKETGESHDAQVGATKKKRIQLDEFDRMLGLQSESRNPITRITATFLGPLMRMFRVFIYLFRISFNISTWRDPYMSFWVCMALVAWCIILLWFPWRSFFLVVTVATVGPQNMFLRYFLEKKAEKKRKKEQEEEERRRAEATMNDDYGYETAVPQLAQDASESGERVEPIKPEPTTNSFFSRYFAKRNAVHTEDDDDDVKVDRPPFRADPHEKVSSNKKVHPRSIVIPYSRFKPDRFYDWPPDPTVSRATPLPPLYESAAATEHIVAPSPAAEFVLDNLPDTKQEGNTPGLRRRQVSVPEDDFRDGAEDYEYTDYYVDE